NVPRLSKRDLNGNNDDLHGDRAAGFHNAMATKPPRNGRCQRGRHTNRGLKSQTFLLNVIRLTLPNVMHLSVTSKRPFVQVGDPAALAGLNQIIQTVGCLTKRVDELANQVAELQKKGKKNQGIKNPKR